MNEDNLLMTGYEKLDPLEIQENFAKLISKDWLLVTAGNKDSYNTMTVSWGAMGFIWNKPVAFAFIRDTRYTHEFLMREEGLTLSFFSPEYKKALGVCGHQSGRDTDKVKDAGLTGKELASGRMSFEEASMIIECKTLFVTKMKWEDMLDSVREELLKNWYTRDSAKHDLFISEITAIWRKI